MNSFLIRLVVNVVAIAATAALLPGITIDSSNYIVTLIVVAIIFGVVNAVIKPILAVLTCPLYILTLGLFTFVMNALMLLLTSGISDRIGIGFHVDGFWTALVGAIIISLISFVLSAFIPEGNRA